MWNWAHFHIAINHLPVVLVPVALALFVAAAVRTNATVLRVAYAVSVASALTAAAAYWSGDPATDLLLRMEPGQKKDLEPRVDEHEDAARFGLIGSLALAALSGWGFLQLRRRQEASPLPGLVVALLTSAALVRAAELGGELRHPEARRDFRAPTAAPGADGEHPTSAPPDRAATSPAVAPSAPGTAPAAR